MEMSSQSALSAAVSLGVCSFMESIVIRCQHNMVGRLMWRGREDKKEDEQRRQSIKNQQQNLTRTHNPTITSSYVAYLHVEFIAGYKRETRSQKNVMPRHAMS